MVGVAGALRAAEAPESSARKARGLPLRGAPPPPDRATLGSRRSLRRATSPASVGREPDGASSFGLPLRPRLRVGPHSLEAPASILAKNRRRAVGLGKERPF